MEEQNNNLQTPDFENYNFDDQEPEAKQKTPMPKSAVAVMVISIIVAISCIIPMLITLLAKGGSPVMFVDEECYLVVNGITTEYKVHSFGDGWEVYDEGEGNCEDKVFYRMCYQCEALEWRKGSYEDHQFALASDGLYHWQQCQNCEAVEDQTVHTATEDGICEVCFTPIGTEGVTYQLSQDGTYAIVTGYNGSESRVMIAGKYDGVPVTAISDKAFDYDSNITAVVIPSGVTTIGRQAFYYCTNLSEVVIPDSVTVIGDLAFFSCDDELYKVYNSAKYVRSGNNPYAVLIETVEKNLSTYELHEDTRIIANGVFKNCTRLTEITIPNGVTAISDSAFYGCHMLNTITIPNSVKAIGEYAFQGCINLKSVELPEGIKSIGKHTFYNCVRLTSVVIPKSVTTIGDYAFNGCSDLTDVYYRGSQSEWQAITRAQGNNALTGATVHYNYAN